MPSIIFEPIFDDVVAPRRATDGSAGYDVSAYLTGRMVKVVSGARTEERASSFAENALTLAPGERALVPLGFKARVPAGYEAQVRIRSSLAFKRGLILPNAPGTIDSDYPDEWLVMVKNDSDLPVAIEHGERIAQVVLARYEVLEWEPGEVRKSTGRTGGFGSTGAKG